MRTLIWSATFLRALKKLFKKHPELRPAIEATLQQLIEDPFESKLATHKLKGKLAGSWACSAGYDLRIIFVFVENPTSHADDIFLMEIGTHEEVY